MSEREVAVRLRIKSAIHALPGAKSVPYVACQGSEAGTPDILGCYRGRMFAIEVKRPGGRPSAIQLKRIAEWQAAGCSAGVASNVAEAMALVQQ